MRRAIWAGALVVLAAACGANAPASPPTVSTGSASPSAEASVEPVGVPPGTPTSYEGDVPASQVPAEALVPAGTSVTDVADVESTAGSSILVMFVEPGADPFHQEHGLVVWRRFSGGPAPWRPVFGFVDPPAAGVVRIRATVGDATGDGSPDVLTFEDTGGSGVCGTWRVLDLAANASVFGRKTCDTTIDLSTDPSGLVVRTAVFAPGDAHCCPSSMRISILTFDPSTGWSVYSKLEHPT